MVEIKMVASAYVHSINKPITKQITVPPLILTEKDILQSFCLFDIAKIELINLDADHNKIKGSIWMTASFKNTNEPSDSCVWWCNVDTVRPGKN
ncbi:hypothetical protein [Salmonella bongori]|uniref:hypothetical protein n=1 Tax=Salmonella bongori TaxID=54736 RepID=UPI00111C6BB7|nr:hypothetical protein [Salmonella bongori]